MINSTPDFRKHSEVIDGASDLLFELFGPEPGRQARSAVGMADLARGHAVEFNDEFELSHNDECYSLLELMDPETLSPNFSYWYIRTDVRGRALWFIGSADLAINFIAVTPEPDFRVESWSATGDKNVLLIAFAGFTLLYAPLFPPRRVCENGRLSRVILCPPGGRTPSCCSAMRAIQ